MEPCTTVFLTLFFFLPSAPIYHAAHAIPARALTTWLNEGPETVNPIPAAYSLYILYYGFLGFLGGTV